MAKKKQARHRFRVEFDCYLDCGGYGEGQEIIKKYLQSAHELGLIQETPVYLDQARIGGPVTLVTLPWLKVVNNG